jgi:hypothetical protein
MVLAAALALPASAAAPGALWLRYLNGPLRDFDEPTAIVASPAGDTVYVTGSVSVREDDAFALPVADYETVAYRIATGERLWDRRYDGPAGSDDQAHSIARSADGSRIYLTGQSIGRSGASQFATIAYDAQTGAQLWVRRYAGPVATHQVSPRLAASPTDDVVYLAGTAFGLRAGERRWVLLAYDGNTGERLWVRRSRPALGRAVTGGIAVNPDGATLYLAGESRGGPQAAFQTAAYDATDGSLRWIRHFDHEGEDVPIAIATSAGGGRVYVTGDSAVGTTSEPTSGATETISYDAGSGATVWTRRFQRSPDSLDGVAGMVVSAGRVVVTGSTETAQTSSSAQTIAYDADGRRLWTRLGAPGVAVGIAASADGGSVDVAAIEVNQGDSFLDWRTSAYRAASGALRWSHRYDSPFLFSSDQPRAITAAGGRVVVSGRADRIGEFPGSDDWATLAYAG